MDLWTQNVKQALRNLRHQGWQSVVSVTGLAVGVVCLTFSLNWLWTETNYDHFRPDYKDLYVLKNEVSYDTAEQIDSLLKGQAEVGVVWYRREGLQMDSLGEEALGKAFLVSPGMVPVLGLKALSGSLEQAFTVPDNVILTESLARKAFGRTDVAGRSFSSQNELMTVGAVVADNAGETTLDYDALIPLRIQNYQRWWRVCRIYFRTKHPEAVLNTLERMRPNEGQEAVKWTCVPLCMAHELLSGDSFLRAYFYPLAFTVIALLLWVSAMVNLLAVYTSVFLGRTREYALRRSLGASDGQNAWWMFTTVLPVLLAGLLLSGMAMEWTTWRGGVPGNLSHAKVAFCYVAAASCIAVGAGMVYPVWKVRRQVRRTFEGRTDSGHSHSWLLVVQCLASAFLLFVSLGMQRQLAGMMRSDLGFDCRNMLRLDTYSDAGSFMQSNWRDDFYNFHGIFLDLPQEFAREKGAGITDAIAMRMDIFNRWSRLDVNVLTEEEWNAGQGDKVTEQNKVAYVEIPYEAFDFFHIRLSEGEAVEHAGGGDRLPVVLNEAARRQLRVQDVTEARLHAGTQEGGFNYMMRSKTGCVEGKPLDVYGVAPIRLTDFHQEEGPLMLVVRPDNHDCSYRMNDAVYVKYAPGRREDAEAAVRRVLRKFDVQDRQIYLTTLEEYIAGSYEEETYYANLLTALTAFSLVVTLSGVFSMLLYALRLRRRSMAIRRVMGAEFRDILFPQLRTYLLFVLVGATVDIKFALAAGLAAVGVIFIVLLFRMVGVFVCMIHTDLTLRERLFCMIAYLPKATVQAAIGSLPLAMGLPCGKIVLTVAVLAILITAPLGAFGIDMTYKRLLMPSGRDQADPGNIPADSLGEFGGQNRNE